MSEISTNTKLQSRLSTFVEWIKPDATTRENNKHRADNIRTCVSNKAEDDGVIVESTPNAGSFATHTGNRRHYRGTAEIEGQDIDLPFVVKPESVDGRKINELLQKFYRYADECYPDTEKEITKSSVKLKFSDKVNYDLVPMLSAPDPEDQIIIRSTGEEVETSVQKHVRFILSRNKSSNEIDRKVKFYQCIRLVKWWRDIQASDGYYLGGDDAPPSFLINLLCAHAYDHLSVENNYAETLAKWMGFLANELKNRKAIMFNDYNNPRSDQSSIWSVIDPVNSDNNVVKNWNSTKIDELEDWFSKSRDNWMRVIRFDEDNEDSKSLEYLVKLFGNPFRNHCGD